MTTFAPGPVEPISSRPRSGLVLGRDHLEELLLEREQPLRALVEAEAGLGGHDAAARAVEKLSADPLLERADLLADRWLRDAEPCCRLRSSRPPPRKRPELPRVHRTSLYRRAQLISRKRLYSGTRAPCRPILCSFPPGPSAPFPRF